MIARLWFGTTRIEDADAYVAYLERTGVAAHRSDEIDHYEIVAGEALALRGALA